MEFKTGIIFCIFLLGSQAVPLPENDLSIFFENADPTASARIVGGTVAAQGAYPWMVAMTHGATYRSFICGGSIVSQRTVLTAAHCIDAVFIGNTLSSSLRVTVGSNRWDQGGQMHALSRGLIHPQYNSNTIKNDIGLLHTATRIVYSSVVRSVALSYNYAGHGINSRVSGWGRTGASAPISQHLLELQVWTVDGNQCINDVRRAAFNLNIRAPSVDPRVELCTFHSRGRGTCRGDSGSALVRSDTRQQIGVVSWGFPCALGGPDMFVRVSAFQTWMQQNILS